MSYDSLKLLVASRFIDCSLVVHFRQMSEWRTAVRRELERYRRRTDEAEVTNEELFSQAEHRFEAEFPTAETPRRSMSRTLGELDESGEIERVEDGLCRILDLSIDDLEISVLSDQELKLLEQWAETIRDSTSGIHFQLEEHNLTERGRSGAERFIEDPSEQSFKEFWGILHSAKQRGAAQDIYNKWTEAGSTDAELAELIVEILEADSYDPGWEDELGAIRTLRELFGVLHIETHPMLNSSTEYGLETFGYPAPDDYGEGTRFFDDFKLDYAAAIGHVREDVAPLNLEIDQLFNVLHKVAPDDIEDANSEAEAKLYRLALDLTGKQGVGDEAIEEYSQVAGSVWQVSPGRSHYGLWPTMQESGLIAIGYGKGDLSKQSKAEIEETEEDRPAKMAYQFANEIAIGDILVAKKGSSREIYGVGVVDGPYYSDEAQARELFPDHAGHDNFRSVDWIIDFGTDNSPRTELPTLPTNFWQPSLGDYSDSYTDLISAVNAAAPEKVERFEEVKRRSAELHGQLQEHLPSIEELADLLGQVDFYWVNQRKPGDANSDRQDPFSGTLHARVDDQPMHALDELDSGDVVIHYYEQKLLGYSIVTAEAEVVEKDEIQRYVVEVNSKPFDEPISKETLGGLLARDAEGYAELPIFFNALQGYRYELPRPAAELLVDCLFRHFGIDGPTDDNAERLSNRLSLPELNPTLPGGLFFEDAGSLQKEIKASLNSGKHIIFTGPPGTGKSELAEHICEERRDRDQIDDYIFSTATAEWTTYDTIGGYMPGKAKADDPLEFNPGQFLRCFREPDDTIVNNWLVIDEINRADIDKAFGQLFSVLSKDAVELPFERDEPISIEWVEDEHRVTDVALNGDIYPVTPAWRLVATMNTADKTSLYEMSYAFMRRFNFIHVGMPDLKESGEVRASLLEPPGEDSGRENYATVWQESLGESAAFLDVLDAIHPSLAVIWSNLNSHRPIGPAIIFDMVSFVEEYVTDFDDEEEVSEALTAAIISLVYPQLEGMRPDEQTSLIGDLSTAQPVDTDASPTHLPNQDRLQDKAIDMFDISFSDDEDES